MTVAGKNRISDIYRSKYRRGVIRERNTPPSRISKNISAVKSKDGQGWKRRKEVVDRRSTRRILRDDDQRFESKNRFCVRVNGAAGRMGDPRNREGGKGPREGWQRRGAEKKRAIRLGRAAGYQTRTNIIQNYPARRSAPSPFSHISSVEKGVLSRARRGWRRWPWRIHARPCVISWLSSVERATQRVAHAREVRKSCGVNTRWWDTRVFHPSRSGFLQSRYLWSGPCFRPRAFSRPSRKPRDSFIIRSDFERTFRRRA